MKREHAILILSYLDGCVGESYQPIPQEFVKEFVNRTSIVELELMDTIFLEYPDLFAVFIETYNRVKIYARAQVNAINLKYLKEKNV